MTLPLGIGLIVLAAGWLLYKTYLSFNSAGGTDLTLVVYDAAIYPPILASVGAFLLAQSQSWDWPLWSYLILWLVLTGLFAGIIRLSEEIGDRRLQ